jgi:4-hydroxybenzoate polyprenyltransferase
MRVDASSAPRRLARPRGPRVDSGVLASLRLGQWAHFGVLPLAAFDPLADWGPQIPSAARGMATALCVLAFGYLVNALGDRQYDRDPSKNPLVGRSPTPRHAILAGGLALGALATSLLGPGVALVATLVALVSGTLYSLGPRLKRLPILGTGLNAACFTPLLFVGIGDAGVEPRHGLLALVFTGLLLQNQILHEAADADEDRGAGVHTSWIVLGSRRSAWLAAGIGVAILLLSLWLLGSSRAPRVLALHALPYLWLFPRALVRNEGHPRAARRWRRLHRLAAGASGALLYAASVLC